MIEERFLTQSYTISNHPICVFEASLRCNYVRALGEFLCYITHADRHAKLIYTLWANSINRTDASENWSYTPNFVHLKKGLYYTANDSISNTLRLSLLFDCFYLAEKTGKCCLDKVYIFLSRKTCGFFSGEILNRMYGFYMGSNNGDSIPAELKNHRKRDYEFQQKKVKRVLVVATMSAGKSTLINALVGNKINKAAAMACTNKIRHIYNNYSNEGAILESLSGRFVYTERPQMAQHASVDNVGVVFHSVLSNERICFIDTPGSNYCGDSTGEITRGAISSNNYDVIVFVINSTQFNTVDEASLREFVIKHTNKPIIFAINQLDSFIPEDDSIQGTINELASLIGQYENQCLIVPVSAYYALLLRIPPNKMSMQEQIQLNRLKQLFQYDYYDLSNYYYGNNLRVKAKKEVDKTGITILEEIIRSI